MGLTNIVKSNHEQSTQLFSQLRESITTVLTTISSTLDLFKDKITGADKKTKPISTDLDNILVTVHDYIKAEVAMHLVDPTKGFQIFLHPPIGCTSSAVIKPTLEKVLGVTVPQQITKIMNRRVHLGQTTLFTHTYVDRGSGHLHDCILTKIANAFFARLPGDNHLSSNACVSDARKQEYARTVDESREYYRFKDYMTAWLNACHTALREIISAGSTSCRNISLHNPECDIPVLQELLPFYVSFYFLGFLVLKVCTSFYSNSNSLFLKLTKYTSMFMSTD